MAQTTVAVTQGSGKNIDAFATSVTGNVRQAVVLADPTTDANTVPVHATLGAGINVLGANGTALDTNSGVKSAGTIRVVLATDQPALTNKILVTPDSVALPANQSVNISQVAAGAITATNVAITDAPFNLGVQAVSSENTAVTTARKVQLVADLVGKLITLPYANPENFVNGTTAAIVDTTSTSTIAAQGVGVRTYITSILVTNSHATVGTFVKILDGATIVAEGFAAALGGGFALTLPVPIRCTANTAVNTQCVTTGSNVIATVIGYKGV